MKRWNKTTIHWDVKSPNGSWSTKLKCNDEVNTYHKLSDLTLTSNPNHRTAIISMVILDASSCLSERRMKNVCDQLISAIERQGRMVSIKLSRFNILRLNFSIKKGEQFCDAAIKVARIILETLGIKDKKDHRLANFYVSQESMVSYKGQWISFADYLRIKHGLRLCTHMP